MTCKHTLIRICCLVLFLLSVPLLMASEQSATQQIVDLLNAEKYQQAYTLASEQQSNFEGDPDFDYAYAIAAKASGHIYQAVFSLERVLQNAPNFLDARLALAASYFELGNLSAADVELRKLQNHPQLSSDLESKVSSYLDTIAELQRRQDQHWHISGFIGAGYDSNPNNGVAEEFIDIPSLGTVTLFQESLENSSTYADLQGQVTYIKPLNQQTSLQFSGSLAHAEYEDQFALDRTFAAATAGIQTQMGNLDVSGSLFYRPLWLDGDSLLNYYGGTVTVSGAIADKLIAGMDLAYSEEDFEERLGFDRDLVVAKLWLTTEGKTGTHKISLQAGEENASDNRDFLDRDILGLGYSWFKQIHSEWQAAFAIDYLDSEYQGVNTLFNQIRDDQFISSEVELKYSYSSDTKIMGRMTYLSNDSEISLHEYERFKVWLGASYEF